jgi:hypothetical protein
MDFRWVIFLSFTVFACKSVSQNSDPAAAIATDKGSEFLAEAVGRIANSRTPFILNHGIGDERNPLVIPTIIDEYEGTLKFDFRRFEEDFPEWGSIERLTEALTFPLPEVPDGVARTLDDPEFAAAFGKLLSDMYLENAQANTSDRLGDAPAGYDFSPGKYETKLQQCEAAGFAENVQINGEMIPVDCSILRWQRQSGLTISGFEFAAIYGYSAYNYHSINGVLRSRRFILPEDDLSMQPFSKLDAVEVMVSLAIISAMNKVDPVPKITYRGVRSPRTSCRDGSQRIFETQAATVPETVWQFCNAFAGSITFQDCGFASASTAFEVAGGYAGIYESNTQGIGIVMSIEGSDGLIAGAISQYPYEREVLFRPSKEFHVVEGSAGIALKTSQSQANGGMEPQDFEVIPCGYELTNDQIDRISHFSIHLAE